MNKKVPVRVRLEFTAVPKGKDYVYYEAGRLKALRRMLRKKFGESVADNVLEDWYHFCTEDSTERVERRGITV